MIPDFDIKIHFSNFSEMNTFVLINEHFLEIDEFLLVHLSEGEKHFLN